MAPKQSAPKRRVQRDPVPRKVLAVTAARKTPATSWVGPQSTNNFDGGLITARADCVACVVSRPSRAQGLETLAVTSDGLLLRLPESTFMRNIDMRRALELLDTEGTPYVVEPGGFIAATWDAFSESVLLLEGGGGRADDAGPRRPDDPDCLRLVQLKEEEDGRNTVSLVMHVWGRGRRFGVSKPVKQPRTSTSDSGAEEAYDDDEAGGERIYSEGSDDEDDFSVSVDSRADYVAAVANSLLASDGAGRVFVTHGPSIDCLKLPARLRAGSSDDGGSCDDGGSSCTAEAGPPHDVDHTFWNAARNICGLTFVPARDGGGCDGGGGGSSGDAAGSSRSGSGSTPACLVAATEKAVFCIQLPNEEVAQGAAAAAGGNRGRTREPVVELLAGNRWEAGNGSADDDDGTGGPSGTSRFMRITGVVAAEDRDGAPMVLVLEQRSYEVTAVRKIRGWRWSAARGGVKAGESFGGFSSDDEEEMFSSSSLDAGEGESEDGGEEDSSGGGEHDHDMSGGSRERGGREQAREGGPEVRVSTLEQMWDLYGSPAVLPGGSLACLEREVSFSGMQLLHLGVRPLQPHLSQPSSAGAPSTEAILQPCGPQAALSHRGRALQDPLCLVQLANCSLLARRSLLIRKFSNFPRFQTNKRGPAWDIPRYDLRTLDPKLMLLLLRWAYLGSAVEVLSERVQALAEAAARLGAAELVELVSARVLAAVDPSTVIDTMLWAEARGPAFRGLFCQLEAWFLEYHQEVMAAAEHSVTWLMTRRPKLALQLWRGTLRASSSSSREGALEDTTNTNTSKRRKGATLPQLWAPQS